MTNVVKEQKSKVRSGKRTTISDVSGVKYREENLRLKRIRWRPFAFLNTIYGVKEFVDLSIRADRVMPHRHFMELNISETIKVSFSCPLLTQVLRLRNFSYMN